MTHTAALIGSLWVGIDPVRLTMRCPASVSNTDMCHKLQREIQCLLQSYQPHGICYHMKETCTPNGQRDVQL